MPFVLKNGASLEYPATQNVYPVSVDTGYSHVFLLDSIIDQAEHLHKAWFP